MSCGPSGRLRGFRAASVMGVGLGPAACGHSTSRMASNVQREAAWHVTSTFPPSPSAMLSDGFLSSWAGHKAR